VDAVEGIGGFVLDVIGVWAFQMRNVFGQLVEIKACIIDGCTAEFPVGVDFLAKHPASLDFRSNGVRYFVQNKLVIIPFRTEGSKGAQVASVRLAKQVKLGRRAVTPVEVIMTAPDGEEGVFLPTRPIGAVLLAATVTVARGGKALVPAINVHGGRVKLPAKKELDTWVPVDKDVEVLAMSGRLNKDELHKWMKTLGDVETPLENEDDVHSESDDAAERKMILELLGGVQAGVDE